MHTCPTSTRYQETEMCWLFCQNLFVLIFCSSEDAGSLKNIVVESYCFWWMEEDSVDSVAVLRAILTRGIVWKAAWADRRKTEILTWVADGPFVEILLVFEWRLVCAAR